MNSFQIIRESQNFSKTFILLSLNAVSHPSRSVFITLLASWEHTTDCSNPSHQQYKEGGILPAVYIWELKDVPKFILENHWFSFKRIQILQVIIQKPYLKGRKSASLWNSDSRLHHQFLPEFPACWLALCIWNLSAPTIS